MPKKYKGAEPEVKEEFIQEVLKISREHKKKYGFRTTSPSELKNLFVTENKNEKFKQNFEKTYQKLEALGKTERWKEGKTRICAWQVPSTTAELLRLLVVETDSKVILELGTSIGYSGLWLGLGAKETKGHLYTCEIFQPKVEIAKKHFKEAGLEKQITVLKGDIKETLPKLLKKKKKIDFVFMDARKEDYLNYYKLVFPALKKNGIIIADNIDDFPHYMKDFLEHIKEDKRVISYPLHIDNGLMLIVKK